MHWSDLPLKPSPRMLREFAGLWLIFFGGLAVWHWLIRDNPGAALAFGLAAATIGPLGLLVPGAVRPIFIAWLTLAFPVGWVISRLLLLILFFGIVTPIAVIFRIGRRDALQLRQRPRQSYWAPKPLPVDLASYLRQY